MLISRSSLRLLVIRRIEILTVLQGLNLALWILQDYVRANRVVCAVVWLCEHCHTWSLCCFSSRWPRSFRAHLGCNVVCGRWLNGEQYKFMNVWVQYAAMIYVGLLGGAMYVNVFYLILHDPDIPEEDREMCINLTAIFITLGILVAAGFVLLADNTFLQNV